MVNNPMFLEQDEFLVAELNAASVSAKGGTAGVQTCLISNKRLYQKGASIGDNGRGVQNGENIVDLRTVSNSGYFIVRHYALLVLGILSLIGFLIAGITTEEMALVIPGIILFVILLIAFRVKQLRVIKVFFPGGCLAFSVLSAKEDTLIQFNRQIQLAAARAKDGNNTTV